MIKKTISYKDFNGKDRIEDYYFNLTKSEISILEMSTRGGLKAKLERIVDTNDGEEIINFVNEILAKSYGERSEDGRSFDKSAEKSLWFLNSAAYDTLFMELVTTPDLLSEFIKGVIPNMDEVSNK